MNLQISLKLQIYQIPIQNPNSQIRIPNPKSKIQNPKSNDRNEAFPDLLAEFVGEFLAVRICDRSVTETDHGRESGQSEKAVEVIEKTGLVPPTD